MSIPAGITTCPVHLDAPVSFTGEPGRVQISITASTTLIWAATGTPVANFLDIIKPDNGEPVEVNLPHTGQPGFLDGAGNTVTNWHYTFKTAYEHDGQVRRVEERDFQIPVGQTDVDLALVPAGEAYVPTVAPILPVTSLAGLNGEITTAELGTLLGSQPAVTGKADAIGAADIEITNTTKGLVLKSANGTRFRLGIADDGALTTTSL